MYSSRKKQKGPNGPKGRIEVWYEDGKRERRDTRKGGECMRKEGNKEKSKGHIKRTEGCSTYTTK